MKQKLKHEASFSFDIKNHGMTINIKILNFDTCPAYQGVHVNKRSQDTYFSSILYIE